MELVRLSLVHREKLRALILMRLSNATVSAKIEKLAVEDIRLLYLDLVLSFCTSRDCASFVVFFSTSIEQRERRTGKDEVVCLLP